MTRAKRGGETGINGEAYKGGQFLPATTLPKMTPGQRKAATRKQEIAPYDWQVPPTPEDRSIYQYVAGTFAQWDQYLSTLKPFEPYLHVCATADAAFDRERIVDLIARWNRGERWFRQERNDA